MIKADAVGSNTVRVGLIGAGIGLSKTPAMHEREAAAQGIDYRYELIDLNTRGQSVEDLPKILDEVQRLGFAGVNVTHPCKQAVLPYLTGMSDDVRALGAANTVVLRNGSRVGHNTDWSGFFESFTRGLPDVRRTSVVMLGAGGAGAAVGHAILRLGAKRLTVIDLDFAKAEQLAHSLSGGFSDRKIVAARSAVEPMADADGLIQATPIGMLDHPGLPIAPELLAPHHWVAEVVYMPFETELLTVARSRGCRTLDGGGMAVFQAVGALRLFAGIEPNPERMLTHFKALVAEEAPSRGA
jgi:quinate/shikimate dehydrogenase (NAD+)